MYKYYRLYCQRCIDFSLHERIYKDEPDKLAAINAEVPSDRTFISVCGCGCIYETVNWKTIDSAKLSQQWHRYKQQRKRETERALNTYSVLSHIFQPITNGITTNDQIKETDAGLEQIEQQHRIQEQKMIKEAIAEANKYRLLGRNDKCICNSGKKFKQCHLPIIEDLKNKFKI